MVYVLFVLHFSFLADDNCNFGNSFLCNELKCIPFEFVCDGVADCISGEDELDCQLPNSCKAWWNAGYQESGLYHIGIDIEMTGDHFLS